MESTTFFSASGCLLHCPLSFSFQSVLLIPYSVWVPQCLLLVVAVRNIFLRTLEFQVPCVSAQYCSSKEPVFTYNSYSLQTLSVAWRADSGTAFNRGSSVPERMDCAGFHYKTSQDNWNSQDLSVLLVCCEGWCHDGECTLGLS